MDDPSTDRDGSMPSLSCEVGNSSFGDILVNDSRENFLKPADKQALTAYSNGGKDSTVPAIEVFAFADSLDYLLMLIGSLGAVAHGATIPVFFLLFGKLINGFGSYQNNLREMSDAVDQYSTYLVYLGLMVFVSSWAEVSCWMYTGERQTAKMRITYLRNILGQDISFFDTGDVTGILLERISTDTFLVQDLISEKIKNFLNHITTFIGGFAVGFCVVWRLCLVTLAVVPVIAFAGGLCAYVLKRLAIKCQQAYEEAGAVADQTITQIRTVHSFAGDTKALESYSRALKITVMLGYRGGLAKGMGMGVSVCLIFSSWGLVLWYAGILVRRGEANGGKMITAIFSVILGGMALGQAVSDMSIFGKAKYALHNIIDMVRNRQPSMDRNTLEGKTLVEVEGNVELSGVNFSYPSRPDVVVLSNFSLKISSRQSLAIVGDSGSGKSTIVALIQRFYDPISGEVLLDGVNIRHLQLNWLRSIMGLVNQEPTLFATTILENILYGKQDATLQEVEQAASLANASRFIENLPDGFQTQVGERGVQLSGGQKQRLALARAVLRNPRILLLDEATSALDAKSELEVQAALEYLMTGRTTIVVAHRLTTIRSADTIAVVQCGRIVEMGKHEELMAKGNTGAYSSMVKLQAMALESDGTILNHSSSLREAGPGSSSRPSSICSSYSSKSCYSDLSNGSTSKTAYVSLGGGKMIVQDWKTHFLKLAKLNAPEWPYAILGAIGSVLAGLLSPIFVLVMGEMLNILYDSDLRRMKKRTEEYAAIFVITGIAALGIYVLQQYSVGVMGENLTVRVREKMFSAILKNEVGWFDQDENSNQLAARFATHALNVRSALGERISTIIQTATISVTACIFAFVVEWRMAAVVLAIFPFIVTAAISQQRFLKGISGDMAGEHAKSTMLAGDAITNIRTVAAFSAEDRVLHMFGEELERSLRRSLIKGNIAGFSFGLSQLVMYASYALILWFGSTLVKSHSTTFGPVLKVFMVLMVTAFSVAETLSLTPDIVKTGISLSSVFAILDRKTRIDPNDCLAERVDSVKGDIKLQHVQFAYPARPEVNIFTDLSLKVRAGQSVALVGASGSGKSSIIALIVRFYDPQAGRVTVDDKDIRGLNLKSLRQHIGLVQQEPALFATTIYGNIAYGRDGVNPTEIEEAAKAANAHAFINALPEGYETKVGERGVQLSGGQRQRIAIARVLVKNPTILLLDEATSALDAESEHLVQTALEKAMKGRTTIVVAHRLSTITNASKIAVLQGGKIVQEGSHQHLIAKPVGPYATLLQIQQQQPPPPAAPQHH